MLLLLLLLFSTIMQDQYFFVAILGHGIAKDEDMAMYWFR